MPQFFFLLTEIISNYEIDRFIEEFLVDKKISAIKDGTKILKSVMSLLLRKNGLSASGPERKFEEDVSTYPLYEQALNYVKSFKNEIRRINAGLIRDGQTVKNPESLTKEILEFLAKKQYLTVPEAPPAPAAPAPAPAPDRPPPAGGFTGALTDEELGAGLGKKLYQRSSVTDAYFLPFLDSFVGKQDGLSNKEKAAFSKVSRYLLNLLISKRVLFESRVILEQGELSAEISNRPPEQYPLWDELKSKIDELLMQDAALLNVFRDAGITPTQFLTNFIQVLKDNKKLGYRKLTNESLNKGSAKIDETVQRWQKLAGLIK